MNRLLLVGCLLVASVAQAKSDRAHTRTVQLAREAWRPGAFEIYFVPAGHNEVIDKVRWKSYLPQPGKTDLEKIEHYGTTHATLHDSDQRVPLVFFGDKYFKKGAYAGLASPADIAPTLARVLKMRLTGDIAGKPREEILVEGTSPRAVLLIVVDQMGAEVFARRAPQMPFLSGLMKDGASFGNARLDYAQSITAVSHAVIGTGAHPKATGISENKSFYPALGREDEVYSEGVPAPQGQDPVDVLQLLQPTLMDQWNAQQKQSHNLAYCMASRAAVGLAGHGAAYHQAFHDKNEKARKPTVFWFDSKSRTFLTDTRWFDIPDSVAKIPALQWTDLKQEEFPYWKQQDCKSLPSKDDKPVTNCLLASPAFARFDANAVVAAIEAGDYGKDEVADIIAVTLKSGDYCGHYMGPESGECGETLAEIDRQIQRLVGLMTKRTDDHVAVVVTADHGVTPTPEVSGAKVLGDVELRDAINKRFAAPDAPIVVRVGASTIQIDPQAAAARKVTLKQISKFLQDYRVDGQAFFADVVTADELAAGR